MFDALARLLAVAAVCCLLGACAGEGDRADALVELTGGADGVACRHPEWTRPVLGPQRFTRSAGKPVEEIVPFTLPQEGTLCISVRNGTHPPPHGERVSSAWLRLDGELVFAPEVFSQQVARLERDWPGAAGDHELSVVLASVPGSFLDVELRLLTQDTAPPQVSIEPPEGTLLDTDTPLLRVLYRDDGSGVDPLTLSVHLNGADVTARFTAGADSAEWQVGLDAYLDDGFNTLEASVADRLGNVGTATSTFEVQVPTAVLVADFTSADPLVRKRSAYKLLSRRDELSVPLFRRCLRQLNDTPEPRAASGLGAVLQASPGDALARALAAGALGEAARVDPAVGARSDLVDILGQAIHGDASLAVKSLAARALGLTLNEAALVYLDEFLEHGPTYPPQPPDCELANEQRCTDYLVSVVVTGFQVLRSTIRIAGHEHVVGNPGDIMAIWERYHRQLTDYLAAGGGAGGAP